MAGALPTTGSDENHLRILGATPQATNGIAPRAETFGVTTVSLSADASKRDIVWDAEIRATTHHGRIADGGQMQSAGLVGQRMSNGEVIPVARTISGRRLVPILHVDLKVRL